MKQKLIRISKPLKFVFVFVLVIGGTVALVAYGQGYIFNLRNGEITEGGLVVLDSEPSNARIWVNGEDAGTTSERLRLETGEHNIDMYRDGYRSWEKSFNVPEGQVIDAEYPILIPEEVETLPVNDITSPSNIFTNSNQSQLAVVHGESGQLISRVTAGNSEIENLVEIPELATDNIETITWGSQSSRMLVKTSANGKSFILVEDGGSDYTYLEDIYNTEFDDVAFSATNGVLYGLSNGQLLRLNLDSESRSTLASSVTDWNLLENRLYMVRSNSNGDNVLSVLEEGSPETIYDFGRKGELAIESSGYEDQTRLVVHDLSRSQVTLLNVFEDGRDPTTRTLSAKAAKSVKLSPNQRFILMRNDKFMQVYDLERQRRYGFELEQSPANDITWYDDHHILYVINGSTVIAEFDGSNRQHLASTDGANVAGVPANDTIYSIGRNAVTDQLMLQSSQLD